MLVRLLNNYYCFFHPFICEFMFRFSIHVKILTFNNFRFFNFQPFSSPRFIDSGAAYLTVIAREEDGAGDWNQLALVTSQVSVMDNKQAGQVSLSGVLIDTQIHDFNRNSLLHSMRSCQIISVGKSNVAD